MRVILPAILTLTLLGLNQTTASAVTRDEIVRLSRSGVSDDVILALVDRDKTIFSIAPEDLVTLKSEGVSEAVVLAMLKSGREEGEAAFAQQAARAAADREAAAWLAPNVVVIGHGPNRPNTGYRGSRESSYLPPHPVYGDVLPAARRSLCVARMNSGPTHGPLAYVTDCPLAGAAKHPR